MMWSEVAKRVFWGAKGVMREGAESGAWGVVGVWLRERKGPRGTVGVRRVLARSGKGASGDVSRRKDVRFENKLFERNGYISSYHAKWCAYNKSDTIFVIDI